MLQQLPKQKRRLVQRRKIRERIIYYIIGVYFFAIWFIPNSFPLERESVNLVVVVVAVVFVAAAAAAAACASSLFCYIQSFFLLP